jgi:hypothetical protein
MKLLLHNCSEFAIAVIGIGLIVWKYWDAIRFLRKSK